MRIGVDIDGVLNDFYGFLVDYGAKYSVEHRVSGMYDPKASKQTGMYNWGLTVGRDFWKEYGIVEMSKLPVRSFAAEVLKKLRNEGDELWIVTGRSNSDMQVDGMDGRSWEEITLEWLERGDIVYDKIEFDLKDKAEFCAQEKIDVMIEDDPRYLQDFAGETKVLVYAEPYNEAYESEDMIRVYSWYDIYAKIRKLKEVKK